MWARLFFFLTSLSLGLLIMLGIIIWSLHMPVEMSGRTVQVHTSLGGMTAQYSGAMAVVLDEETSSK